MGWEGVLAYPNVMICALLVNTQTGFDQLTLHRMKFTAVPTDWKRANVSPIYKKGNKRAAENYRPVSLASQYSNLMEAIIRDEIVEYLEASNNNNNTAFL